MNFYANITPLTNVSLLHNVPLDSTYSDTLDFPNVSAQTAYFRDKALYTISGATPVRMQNTIRVPYEADRLYTCNYIMFQNANFGAKWFYAFIDSIDYINTNVSEIRFTLDAWQTWQFNISINDCWVEREHQINDYPGSNVEDEHLALGEYVTPSTNVGSTGLQYPYPMSGITEWVYVVAATFDTNLTTHAGALMRFVYNGVYFNVFEANRINELSNFLNRATDGNKADGIVSVFQIPKVYGEQAFTSKSVTLPKEYANIDGYVPKNQKLFTYPYNFLYITNNMGNSATFEYERFTGSNCVFNLQCSMDIDPVLILMPNDYKKMAFNLNEKMDMKIGQQCSYIIDAYKAWLAQNGSAATISLIGSAASLTTGIATANPAAIIGGTTNIASQLAQWNVASTQPAQARGAFSSTTLTNAQLRDFYASRMCITAEYARIIDDYFEMYGYATRIIKKPNIRTRPYWNYVKTQRANITGTVPFNDINTIKAMFNDGVTFWHGDYVGNYSLNNH